MTQPEIIGLPKIPRDHKPDEARRWRAKRRN